MTDITDNIPGLKIEASNDGTITLEQEWSGNVDRVAIHVVHVRHLAERLGLVREASASDAELLRTERGHVADLRKENDRLKRNMLRLHAHALDLQEDFRENADWKHADLTHEMNSINALVSLMDMAVDDFADDYTAHEPSGKPRVTQTKATGSVAERGPGALQKTGGFGVPVEVTPSHAKSRCTSATPADPAPLKTAPQQLGLEG